MLAIISACRKLLEALAGMLCCILFCIFVILSIPIYIFRRFVPLLARRFKPDLETPLNALSNILVNDYFSGKPPRSNCIAIFTLKGHWKKEEFVKLVEERWINPKGKVATLQIYQKFQQYPYRWLGFTFWKRAGNKFNIFQQVIYHENREEVVTREKLDVFTEKLLNEKFKPETSPWELHYVDNYRDEITTSEEHFVLILKFHHCLADGISMRSAIIEGLGGQVDIKLVEPLPQHLRSTIIEKLKQFFIMFLNSFFVISYGFSKTFSNCPWKVKDEKKSWSQHYGRSAPVDIECIKDIKNAFCINFTSVLLSAVSSAIHREFKLSGRHDRSSMSCMSVLPVSGHCKKLSNKATATIFDIPTCSFHDQVSRLRACEFHLQKTKRAGVPNLLRFYQGVVGYHLNCFSNFFSKNRWISVGLTNFAFSPVKVEINKAEIISADITVGALQGDQGLLFVASSYRDQIIITVTAEKGLFTEEQVQNILKFINDEISMLHKLAMSEQI